MIFCSKQCIPCCDFCIHAIQHEIEYKGERILNGPIGCKLHPEEEYQYEAISCGYCDDYQCCQADKEKGKWIEIPYGNSNT